MHKHVKLTNRRTLFWKRLIPLTFPRVAVLITGEKEGSTENSMGGVRRGENL